MMNSRTSGLLLHISSLPSPFPIGDLGAGAYRFADFLVQGGFCLWQVLPLNPTNPISHHSPYSSDSAFAANPLLISPEMLAEDGLLSRDELPPMGDYQPDRVDYELAGQQKGGCLEAAFQRFQDQGFSWPYQRFCRDNAFWLDDFALFRTLKKLHDDQGWFTWPQEHKDRHPEALERIRHELARNIEREKVVQYFFFSQWARLKAYCNERGVQIFGDIPIYVSYDSSDVWANREQFKLDPEGNPVTVAGVPPDYFSETGQLWGNPVYNWDHHKETGYRWWIDRLKHTLNHFDLIRIDHFRGFVGFWEVPNGEETAINGEWTSAPAYHFFRTLLRRFPALPIIAEDLGEITPDVREAIAHFGFPGMKILTFAFDSDDPNHSFQPHNYTRNCVVYTGTHDNNTTFGWIENEAAPEEKERLFNYLGRHVEPLDLPWVLIRLGMQSVANLMVVPMQDLLCLPETARMNTPATREGNWLWRVATEQLSPELAAETLKMNKTYGRI
jgi:4-alpha-glucanotransferase